MTFRFASAATIAGCALGLLVPAVVAAHGLAPALLSLRETSSGAYEVTWRSSMLGLPGANVRPVLPERCRATSAPQTIDDADRFGTRWTVDCGGEGLAGAAIAVAGLADAKIDALLRIEGGDGTTEQLLLSARTPSFTVPVASTRSGVMRQYVRLGVGRTVTAADHLLFMLGLVLVVLAIGRPLPAVAAFMIGYSLMLSASALGGVTLPPGPVRVLVALSVLVLAVELCSDPKRRTLLRRFPFAIAFFFGLCHGAGFATALADVGPGDDLPVALLSFNVGLELGQLTVVATVLLLAALFTRWRPGGAPRAMRAAVYAMGIVSAYWCFERLAVWLG